MEADPLHRLVAGLAVKEKLLVQTQVGGSALDPLRIGLEGRDELRLEVAAEGLSHVTEGREASTVMEGRKVSTVMEGRKVLTVMEGREASTVMEGREASTVMEGRKVLTAMEDRELLPYASEVSLLM